MKYELSGDVSHYLSEDASRSLLLERGESLSRWLDARYGAAVDPYSKYTTGVTGPVATAFDRRGAPLGQGPGGGVNFASQDYLGLSSHPAVLEAAREAIDAYGVHSAGSPALMGDSLATVQLRDALQEVLGYRSVSLFSTGWAAGYGIVRALVRPGDHIVIDRRAHACLLEAAQVSTRNLHLVEHLDTAAMIQRVVEIRGADASCGILVVTESLFSMDADCPDIPLLQDLCTRHGATLLVDCAHDLGSMGEGGLGNIGDLGMRGKIDIVMGSFSKTFASNGGFVATQAPSLAPLLTYACGPRTFSNALSPVQAATVATALRIACSPEGDARRAQLLANAKRIRGGLTRLGLKVLGAPSPIVPFVAGDLAEGRLLTKHLLKMGALVNLVEYPAVSRSTSLIRLQLMSSHTAEHVDQFLAVLESALGRLRDERGAPRSGSPGGRRNTPPAPA